jgi:hypothetical protein
LKDKLEVFTKWTSCCGKCITGNVERVLENMKSERADIGNV